MNDPSVVQFGQMSMGPLYWVLRRYCLTLGPMHLFCKIGFFCCHSLDNSAFIWAYMKTMCSRHVFVQCAFMVDYLPEQYVCVPASYYYWSWKVSCHQQFFNFPLLGSMRTYMYSFSPWKVFRVFNPITQIWYCPIGAVVFCNMPWMCPHILRFSFLSREWINSVVFYNS